MTEEQESEPAEAAPDKPVPGRVEWLDLTVPEAGRIRDFYKAVVGWKSSEVDMGGYPDFNMNLPEGQETVAGICHARGSNAGLPPQWLVYVRVTSVNDSIAACEQKGGKVVDGPRRLGGMNFCVIQDPAGAVMALMSD